MRPSIPAAPSMTVWPADHQSEDSSERIPFVNVPVSLVPPPCGACGTLAMRVTRVKAPS